MVILWTVSARHKYESAENMLCHNWTKIWRNSGTVALLAFCGVFFFAVPGQEPSPLFATGDRWTYHREQDEGDRQNYTETVRAVSDDGTPSTVIKNIFNQFKESVVFTWRKMICLASISSVFMVQAQGFSTEFPPDAEQMNEESFSSHLLGKIFTGRTSAGVNWTMEFGSDHSFRINYESAEGRKSASGKARMEGDKLCQDLRKSVDSGCNAVRWKDDKLFYKRNSNAEVVALTAR